MTFDVLIYFAFAIFCLVSSIWIHFLPRTYKNTASLIDIQFLIPIIFLFIGLVLSYFYKPALMYYINLFAVIFSASITHYFIQKFSLNSSFLIIIVKSLLLSFIISNFITGIELSLNFFLIKIDRMVYLPRITVPIATPSIIGNMFNNIKLFVLIFIIAFLINSFVYYYDHSMKSLIGILASSIIFISIYVIINIYNLNFQFPDPQLLNDYTGIPLINLITLVFPLLLFLLLAVLAVLQNKYITILGSLLLFVAFFLSALFFSRLYDFRSLWITILSNGEFLFAIIIELAYLLGFALISYGITKGSQQKIANHEVVQ